MSLVAVRKYPRWARLRTLGVSLLLIGLGLVASAFTIVQSPLAAIVGLLSIVTGILSWRMALKRKKEMIITHLSFIG